MNKGLIAAALLFLSLPVYGEEPVKVSVAELLNPDTRLQAFQQFKIRSNPEDAKRFEWNDLKQFGWPHSDLSVSTLRDRSGTASYLVTWKTKSIDDDWKEADAANGLSGAISRIAVPQRGLHYQLFTADGTQALEKEGDLSYTSECIINDFNGDGVPEIIERVATGGLINSTIPGLDPIGSLPSAGTEIEFLQIRSLNESAEPSFAVLYNTHPANQLMGNTWGFQVCRTDEAGLWEIQLGPIKAPAGVEPQVTFRWDKEKQTWIGPESNPGDHFRVLTSDNFNAEAVKIAREGGLGYPLVPDPQRVDKPFVLKQQFLTGDDLPPELLAKPYRYESLAGLTDQQLFAYMSERRTAWDYIREHVEKASRVPSFWSKEPRTAALAYVHHNRPPATHSKHLLSVFNPANEAPPTKGDLTLSDGPSGCFSPGGAYIHHLHCAPEGSFLVYAETIHYWYQIPPTEIRLSSDFRKLDLTYEQARDILQTVWWLSRIRSRQLTSGGAEFTTGSSTSDGYATVQIQAEGKNVTVSATRSAGHGGGFLGVGEMGEEYDPSAFINLVVQLFRREIPEHLGDRWKSLEMARRWNEAINAPEPHTPEELARIKDVTRELLRLYREGKLAAAAAVQAVETVGNLGWKDLRGEVEQLVNVLPPPSDFEKRITGIENELKAWTEKLGNEDTSYQAHHEREARRRPPLELPSVVIPGLTDPYDTDTPVAPAAEESQKPSRLSPEDEAKFGEFDRLFKEHSSILYSAPKPQRDIIELRKAVPITLRQVDSYNDPEALFQWALQNELITQFTLSRLVSLDRKRALELLLNREQAAEHEMDKQRYSDARKALESGDVPEMEKSDQPLSEEQRIALLSTLRDSRAAYSDRHRALEMLVSANAPNQYNDPAIDDALRALLVAGGKGEILPGGIPMALARRLSGKAWEPLMAFAQKKPMMPMLDDALPALVYIAQQEGEPYRTRLRELLGPELTESHGRLDAILWSIWRLGFRELKGDVERIATSGEEDYEGVMAGGRSNHKKPVIHRFHRARHIAAMWNEEDALTRARLLVAFAMAESREFVNEESGAREHLRNELRTINSTLDPAQREALSAFVKWCGTEAVQKLPDRTNAETIRNVSEALR